MTETIKYIFASNWGSAHCDDIFYVVEASNESSLIKKIVESRNIINEMFFPTIYNHRYTCVKMSGMSMPTPSIINDDIPDDDDEIIIDLDSTFYKLFADYYGNDVAIEQKLLLKDIDNNDGDQDIMYFGDNRNIKQHYKDMYVDISNPNIIRNYKWTIGEEDDFNGEYNDINKRHIGSITVLC